MDHGPMYVGRPFKPEGTQLLDVAVDVVGAHPDDK